MQVCEHNDVSYIKYFIDITHRMVIKDSKLLETINKI